MTRHLIMHFVLLPCILLTLPAKYAVQGLRNGRVSVRPSVCPIDRHLPFATACARAADIQGGPKQRGHRLMTIILSILNRLKKIHWKIPWQICSYMVLIIPPYLAYVATLPCETSMSAKQAISNKLQGSVVARLRRGGVVNNQIKKKGLLMSLWVKFFLNRWIFGEVMSKNVIVSCTLHAWSTHC